MMAHIASAVQQCWGFADRVPSLLTLKREAAAKQATNSRQSPKHTGDVEDEDSYITRLENSHAFSSNACVAAMAAALGLTNLTTSLAGSMFAAAGAPGVAVLPAEASGNASHTNSKAWHGAAANMTADLASEAVQQQVDHAWADEAVKRGVAHAKAGDYQQAMGCYDKALDLNPSSCDALVARGAAHANQGHFRAAVADFETALQHQPGNANAAKYLQATRRHMQAAAATDPDQQERVQDQRTPLPAAAAATVGAGTDKETLQRQQQRTQDSPAIYRRNQASPSAQPSSAQQRNRQEQQSPRLARAQRTRNPTDRGRSLADGDRSPWGRERAVTGSARGLHQQHRSRSSSKGRDSARHRAAGEDSRGRSPSRDGSEGDRMGRGRYTGLVGSRSRSRSSAEGGRVGRSRYRERYGGPNRSRERGRGGSLLHSVPAWGSRSPSHSSSDRSRSKRSKHHQHSGSSSSGGGSDSDSGSSSSRSRSTERGTGAAGGQRLTLSDIEAAIHAVRSAKKASRQHKGGSRGNKTKKKHKKHSRSQSTSKHKHKRSKRHR